MGTANATQCLSSTTTGCRISCCPSASSTSTRVTVGCTIPARTRYSDVAGTPIRLTGPTGRVTAVQNGPPGLAVTQTCAWLGMVARADQVLVPTRPEAIRPAGAPGPGGTTVTTGGGGAAGAWDGSRRPSELNPATTATTASAAAVAPAMRRLRTQRPRLITTPTGAGPGVISSRTALRRSRSSCSALVLIAVPLPPVPG